MGTPTISREVCVEAWSAYEAHGRNAYATAQALDMPRPTLQNRLSRGRELYGLGGNAPKPTADGQVIKGMSTLYDAEGNERLQWVKTVSEPRHEDIKQAIVNVFEAYKGRAATKNAKDTDEDLLTVYPIVDHHLGLYAWGEETGEDWDLEIGEKTLRDTMRQLVSVTPKSKTAIVLCLGDFFHTDTSKNQTAHSGNTLDVDTRYAKVVETGVKVFLDCIHMAAEKHERVIVRCLPGNHDEHSTLILSVAFSLYFDAAKNIDITSDPSRFFSHEFGKVMIAATHGDMVKLGQLPGVMAAYWPEVWGQTKYRYGLTGHVHHNSKTKLEHSGAQCESLQSLVAKDAWHSASGYSSGRSMVAITYHKEHGEKFRSTVAL